MGVLSFFFQQHFCLFLSFPLKPSRTSAVLIVSPSANTRGRVELMVFLPPL
jgi:hypothetical protein